MTGGEALPPAGDPSAAKGRQGSEDPRGVAPRLRLHHHRQFGAAENIGGMPASVIEEWGGGAQEVVYAQVMVEASTSLPHVARDALMHHRRLLVNRGFRCQKNMKKIQSLTVACFICMGRR
jgi:hypothetical protein